MCHKNVNAIYIGYECAKGVRGDILLWGFLGARVARQKLEIFCQQDFIIKRPDQDFRISGGIGTSGSDYRTWISFRKQGF
jgi:hypothetical protein